MREKLLEYALTRLSAPQYDEFCKVTRQEPGVSTGTRMYWMEVAEHYLSILGYTDEEIWKFIGGLICVSHKE